MKKFLIMTAMAAMMATTSSCGQHNPPPSEGSRTGFALNFFRNVNAAAEKGENILVSPYSAGVALSMLEIGSEGETKAELDNVLNGTLFKDEKLGNEGDVEVKSSNSLWVSSNFSVRNRYVAALEKDFDAFVDTPDFSDPGTAKKINTWCSDHTAGKIKEVVGRLNPDIVMILINALYFNAPWENAFDPDNTREDVFHGTKGDVNVPMMSRKANYAYTEYQGCSMIELPYEEGRYAMYVVLPPEGMSVDSMIPYIGEEAYETAMNMLVPREVAVTMPRFKMETSLILNQTLDRMGLKTAFTSAADFKGISVSGPLQIDLVKQKCYIDVSEKGTEAAAVTSIQVRTTAFRPVTVMKIDRPFLFMIADRESKDILFAGKVLNL